MKISKARACGHRSGRFSRNSRPSLLSGHACCFYRRKFALETLFFKSCHCSVIITLCGLELAQVWETKRGVKHLSFLDTCTGAVLSATDSASIEQNLVICCTVMFRFIIFNQICSYLMYVEVNCYKYAFFFYYMPLQCTRNYMSK